MNQTLLKTLGSSVAFMALGATSFAVGPTVVTADIVADTTWSLANSPYILDNAIFVKNGATLTIEAGVIVRGQPGTPGTATTEGTVGALIVTRDGSIIANGTSSAPIIFTTAATDNDNDGEFDGAAFPGIADRWEPGDTFHDADPLNSPLLPFQSWKVDSDPVTSGFQPHVVPPGSEKYNRYLWGGVVVLGRAPTNSGFISGGTEADNSSTNGLRNDYHEQFIEGLSEVADGVYGGTNPNDSSGSLSYISIRHAGSVLAVANELNGLTMGGVGFGTRIENIEVYMNGDDGFEFFGGTVNTRNLAAIFCLDDSFDVDEGFTGLGQFWFSLQADDQDTGNHGMESDGVANVSGQGIFVDSINGYTLNQYAAALDAGGGLPSAYMTLYNATFIGGTARLTSPEDSGRNDAFRIRDSFGGTIANSIFVDFGEAAFTLDDDGADKWAAGDVVFLNNHWFNFAGGLAFPTLGGSVNTADERNLANAAPVVLGLSPDDLVLQVFNNSGAMSGNVSATDPFSSRRLLSRFSRRSGLDPRPGSALTPVVPATATFFTSAPYRGAFNPGSTALWTDGWTAANRSGVVKSVF